MSRLLKITTIALAGLAATACATQNRQMAQAEAVSMLRQQPTEAASHAHEVVGLTAVTYGYRWTGANLLEQAVDSHANVSSRFNLATGYVQTGRLAEAAALYRGLVRDGQFTWAVSRRDPINDTLAPRRFNIAEESARRLADIERRLTYSAPGGAFAATEAGTPVAAIVGGAAPARGRISDEEAMRRDGIVP